MKTQSLRHFNIFILAISSSALAYNIECDFRNDSWFAYDTYYYCDLVSDINISKCSRVINVDMMITSVSGKHFDGKSNADVAGFRANRKTVNYFPNGLENVFNAKKIVFIDIWGSGLKEIHENDLAPFTNVKQVNFASNEIEVIEHDLFKYNPQLESVAFPRNKIKKVDVTVFDNLNNLTSLFMLGNVCVKREAYRNRTRVLELINKMKRYC